MESTKAVGTACHHYDRGSYIEVLRRLAGGSSWRARVSGYGHHYDSCPGLSVYLNVAPPVVRHRRQCGMEKALMQ